MKVVIAVEGSAGDFQPAVAFCKYLAEHGHRAVLCSSCTVFHVEESGELVLEQRAPPKLPEGCQFVQLPIWEKDPFQEAMTAVAKGEQEAQFTAYGKWFGSMCLNSCKLVAEAVITEHADVFLSNNAGLAYVIHEAHDIPCGKLILQPQMATRDFPALQDPMWTKLDIPACERKISTRGRVAPSDEFHRSYDQFNELVQLASRSYIKEARAQLSTTPASLPEDAGTWAWLDGPRSDSAAPRFALNTFSPCFFYKGFSYGPEAPLVGPWIPSEDDRRDAPIPEGLTRFLQSCTQPPAYVGFGSMSINGAAHWTKLAVSALRALDPKRQHIVSSGWAGLSLEALDVADEECLTLREWAAQHVFFIKGHISHAWLLPQCSMAVHHGGAGTTHAVARAGLPQVIAPLLCDQPFWGVALEEYGAGVRVQKYLADPSLTAGELCAAMQRAGSEEVKDAAQRLQAEMLGQGDGRKNAMDFLQSILCSQVKP